MFSRAALGVLLVSACNLDSSLPAPPDVAPDPPAVFAQRAYLKASNTGLDDHFGWSVAVSTDGGTMAIGAPEEDSAGNGNNDDAVDAGAVYVYVRDGASWSHQAYLKASTAGAGDQFGYSVALSADGNTLVVGAPKEDSGSATDETDDSTTDSGATYVFSRSGTTWSQDGYLKAAVIDVGSTTAQDNFGLCVTISGGGDLVAIGSPGEDAAREVPLDPTNNSAVQSGAVYVFERAGAMWTQREYHKASAPQVGDSFGYQVAFSSDGLTLAVGAAFEDSGADGIDGDEADAGAPDSGAVYLFFGFNSLTQTDFIKASNSDANDVFGAAVAISGNGLTLVVGCHGEDSNATGIDGEDSDNSAENSGAAYVFTKTAGVWQQQSYLKAANAGAGDFFSRHLAVSADGNTIAVGALFEDSDTTGIDPASNESGPDSGAVYLFERDGASWKQGHFIKSATSDPVDNFGLSVSLDASGGTLVAGAYLEDSEAQAVDGDSTNDSARDSGAAYVFETGP